MGVQSVTSGASSAYTNQAAQASKSQQTSQAQQLAAPPEKKTEAPKPVVNTSGHKTGTTINVTA